MCIIFLTNISIVQASGAFPAQISQQGRLVQTFLRQPVDQTAKQGDHVTLPCQVENKRGSFTDNTNTFFETDWKTYVTKTKGIEVSPFKETKTF